jgi:hypothetical protein
VDRELGLTDDVGAGHRRAVREALEPHPSLDAGPEVRTAVHVERGSHARLEREVPHADPVVLEQEAGADLVGRRVDLLSIPGDRLDCHRLLQPGFLRPARRIL